MRTRILLLIAFFQLAALSYGQKYEIYGTTVKGGAKDAGTIYKMDENGNNLSEVYAFEKNEASSPEYTSLCEASNGKFYGVTSRGGQMDKGVIFEYEHSTNTYKTLYEFVDSSVGHSPFGSLIQASNGLLYGMTSQGGIQGSNSSGVIFEFDLATNTYSILHIFSELDGFSPVGDLLEASIGKLYGIAQYGGINNNGTLFQFDISTKIFTKKVDFKESTIGAGPQGSLIKASNGKLYGVNKYGGAFSSGLLFEYTISTNTILNKHSFNYSGGFDPFTGPIQASNGKLYGLTKNGGNNNLGVIYEFDISSNTYVKKHDFVNAINGTNPNGKLIEVTNGVFYGLTPFGGLNSYGVLFEYNLNTNSYSKKADFKGSVSGLLPKGSLIKASNNLLLGISNGNTWESLGCIFEYNISTNAIESKINFTNYNNGKEPVGDLIYASNEKLYGLTLSGGLHGSGCIFEYEPQSGSIESKFDFNIRDTSIGAAPKGYLVNGGNNKFYGISKNNDLFIENTLFEYDYVTDTFLKLHYFKKNWNTPLNYYDDNALIKHSNGSLYGFSRNLITNNAQLFEFNISSKLFRVIHEIPANFNNYLSLVEGPSGTIIGTVSEGDFSQVSGYIFSYNFSPDSLEIIHVFNGVDGGGPRGKLKLINNTKLIGITNTGGLYSRGVVYEFDLASEVYTKKMDLKEYKDATYPVVGIEEVFPDKYYLPLFSEGQFKSGQMFEYSALRDTFVNKYDFNNANKLYYPASKLIKVPICGMDTTISPVGHSSIGSNCINASYQWLDCLDNYKAITGANSQIYTILKDGSYAVEITKNGCIDTSFCMSLAITVSENQLSNNLAVFPNPTNSIVTLSLGGLYGAFTTQVYNVHGMLINESTHQSATQVEVELGESEGIYFIHLITSNGEKVVRKVVKN